MANISRCIYTHYSLHFKLCSIQKSSAPIAIACCKAVFNCIVDLNVARFTLLTEIPTVNTTQTLRHIAHCAPESCVTNLVFERARTHMPRREIKSSARETRVHKSPATILGVRQMRSVLARVAAYVSRDCRFTYLCALGRSKWREPTARF